MNKNLSIDSKGLDSATDEMEKCVNEIKDLFERCNNTFKSMHNSDLWSGEANDSFYNRYNELSSIFPKVNEGLDIYIKFLRITSGNYQDGENKINNNIDTNDIKLNVN